MDEMTQLKGLAATVEILADRQMEAVGETLVLKMAILALVRSHPDRAAFAREFRRCWQLSGSQHSNPGIPPRTASVIDAALETLEEVCPELDVRPRGS